MKLTSQNGNTGDFRIKCRSFEIDFYFCFPVRVSYKCPIVKYSTQYNNETLMLWCIQIMYNSGPSCHLGCFILVLLAIIIFVNCGHFVEYMYVKFGNKKR